VDKEYTTGMTATVSNHTVTVKKVRESDAITGQRLMTKQQAHHSDAPVAQH